MFNNPYEKIGLLEFFEVTKKKEMNNISVKKKFEFKK